MRPANIFDHPERARILDEIHARPVDLVACPSRIRRVAVLLPRLPDAVESAFLSFSDWCRSAGLPPPPPHCRQHRLAAGRRLVTWELHTEFATLTWATSLDDDESWPADVGLDAFGGGALIAATRVDCMPGTALDERARETFAGPSFCASRVEAGSASIATDFVPDGDGFTRYAVVAGELPPLRRAVLIRRLLEIETYRSLALLGLPLARRISPELNALEDGLRSVVEDMADTSRADEEQRTLAALHDLSVRAGRLVEHTTYRFAASAAYGKLLAGRLDSLDEQALAGASSLMQYLSNRSEPALATCLAVEKRQLALSDKIHRATELLHTRIGLKIEAQNQIVLTSIAETATSQFRLQRTVESLSVVAISYYFLGVMGYVLTGLGEVAHFSKSLTIAAAAPIVVITVWLLLRIAGGKRSNSTTKQRMR